MHESAAPFQPHSLTDTEARLLLDAVPEACIILDENGRTCYVNREAERIHGKPAQELLGRDYWNEWPENLRSDLEALCRRAAKKRLPVRFERRHEGLDVWLEIRARPFRSGLALHYRDITRRKRREEHLRRRLEDLEAIWDNLPAALAVSKDADCRDVRPNAMLAQILGVGAGQNVSMSGPSAGSLPFRFFADELPQETAHRQGRPSPAIDLEVVRDDGARFTLRGSAVPLLDDAGRVRGSVAAYLDVTTLRAAERHLRESEERYRSLVLATSTFVWTSGADGEFSRPQPAWEAYTGQAWDEHQGSGWIEAVHPDDRDRVAQAWNAAVQSRSLYEVECRLWNAATGEWRHCTTRSVPVLGTNGEAREWIGAVTDIHERKLLEVKVQQDARTQSLGVLAGGIAHHFNNLLVAILGNASLAMEVDGPKAIPMLEQVIQAGEQAAHLTRQMLAYAGKGRFVVEPVDLSTEVRQVASLLHSALPADARLDLQLADGLPSVRADRVQIQQIVMNLLVNAGEALPESGGRIHVRTEAGKGVVVLTVEDDGFGIHPEVKERIFDPFFTTKFAGRGLGLAAVQGIVEAHGGRVEVVSAPGNGTTFRVVLPGMPAIPPESATVEANPPASAQAVVLVVDREPLVLAQARRTFAGAGIRGYYAEGGREALHLFRDHAHEIDLVVLDVLLADLGGLEVLRSLREIRPDVRVILSSGNSKSEIQRYFGEHAPSGFLAKPYGAAALIEAIAASRGRE